MEPLTCPKCQGAMRTYERNGVHVDQCGESGQQSGQLGAIVSELARQAAGHKSSSSHGYPRKKKSLLGELFG